MTLNKNDLLNRMSKDLYDYRKIKKSERTLTTVSDGLLQHTITFVNDELAKNKLKEYRK